MKNRRDFFKTIFGTIVASLPIPAIAKKVKILPGQWEWERFAFPIICRVSTDLICQELVKVQPMDEPTGFRINFRYSFKDRVRHYLHSIFS